MNRTTLSLLAGTAALAAVTGFATLSSPQAATTAGTAAELPVERTSLLCPEPSTSEVAETSYTSFTPVTKNTGNDGKAELKAAAEESDGQNQSQSKNKGKSILAEHRLDVCHDCHVEITNHVLVPCVPLPDRERAATVRYERVR